MTSVATPCRLTMAARSTQTSTTARTAKRNRRSGQARGPVTADIEFDVPVRFDSDQTDITIETCRLDSWGSIPMLEIRPELAQGSTNVIPVPSK